MIEYSGAVSPADVPEPATLSLLLTGAAAAFAWRRLSSRARPNLRPSTGAVSSSPPTRPRRPLRCATRPPRCATMVGMSRLARALRERILVLDGAMGTMIQAAELTASDFGGERYEGCNEYLNLTRPDVIRGMHADEVQAAGLLAGGVDALLLETAQDTLNLKAAALGVRAAQHAAGRDDVPLMVSATIEPMGTMLAGQGVEALYISLQHLRLFSIGLNCATGPEFMTDHLRSLAGLA